MGSLLHPRDAGDAVNTLAARLEAIATTYSARPALIFQDRAVSFARLAADARAAAAALARLGVSKGTRVAILMPNRPDWLRCAFGIWHLGAILVPINTLFRATELAHALRHADVTVLLAVSRFLNHDYQAVLADLCPELDRPERPIRSAALPCLRSVVLDGEPRPRGAIAWNDLIAWGHGTPDKWPSAAREAVVPSDDAAIFFTSGSTATPKGVVHTHAGLLQSTDNVADRLGLDSDDRTWGYLPFFFNGGLVGVALATLFRGGAVLLQEVFDAAETFSLMQQHGCTTLFAWPHQVEALIRLPNFDRSKLRIRKGVGANTPWAAKLYPPDHHAVSAWGMTETGPMAASSRFDDALALRVSAHGRAMPGLDIRIVDPETGRPLPANVDGEIIVRGSSLMRTYYKHSPADCFDADGFFHTGDCGRLDETGHLHFLGRIKDVIKAAGVSVAAAEIEAVLLAYAGIKIAHVVPVPDPTRGENIAAFVVAGDTPCTEEEILAHCRSNLASYKVPLHVFLCREDELPTLGSGKVDRRQLRALAAERAGRVESRRSKVEGER